MHRGVLPGTEVSHWHGFKAWLRPAPGQQGPSQVSGAETSGLETSYAIGVFTKPMQNDNGRQGEDKCGWKLGLKYFLRMVVFPTRVSPHCSGNFKCL